jgi:leucyl-tRNA synthetase
MSENFEDFLKRIGSKWQKIWEEEHTFEADPDPIRPKFFLTFPYPYVNGSVHLGHGYTIMKADFLARFKRMNGYNVLFPQGFHATGEPIAGMAKRLAQGDEGQIRMITAFGIPKKDISKFYDPVHIVKIFVEMMENDLRSVGTSVDWRRKFITTTITPTYSRFIEWQYETLRANNRVTLGTHPVIFCPSCRSPTGDHDRLEGQGASVQEFTMVKFRYNKAFFPAATLRPETTFGVTNMFLHPDVEYVKAQVDEEIWIVAKEALAKIGDQGHTVSIISEHKGRDFIGKTLRNPLTDHEFPILPATFVDPSAGSGVVMSVPSHAPVDWVAIKNLKDDPQALSQYGIAPEVIDSIEPISLIALEGYGEHPAIEIVEKMGITDQNDPKVEEATKIIYKREFHTGFTKELTGKYAGTSVRDIKDILTRDFTESGIGTPVYETSAPVSCKCGTPCHVKVLSEQWFLKYGDPGWKELTHMYVNEMTFFPPEARASFDYTIDWFVDKACARKSGLGTPLPWDKDWIVETLSDSTIYMSYYTISHYFNTGRITIDNAGNSFFSYLFKSEGDPSTVAKENGISEDLLETLKDEFEYWYPIDIRLSGKDLVMNHLTFCLFQHAALFRPEHQPQAMSVNGFMSFQGQKMSKSLGVLTPLSEAVETYGADLARLGLLGAGEGLDDTNFIEKEVRGAQRWLETLYRYSTMQIKSDEWSHIDDWLQSRLQDHIEAARGYAEDLKTRSYVQTCFFDLLNDIRWYIRRAEKLGPAFSIAIKAIVQMMNPVVPHLCEEIWSSWKNGEHLTFHAFPESDSSKKDLVAEDREKYLRDLMDDIEKIKQATKISSFDKMAIHVADPWKYVVYNIATSDIPRTEIIKKAMQEPVVKEQGKEAAKYVQKLQREFPRARRFDQKEEFVTLQGAKKFLEENYGCEVSLEYAHESSDPRAKLAEPFRPAITLA